MNDESVNPCDESENAPSQRPQPPSGCHGERKDHEPTDVSNDSSPPGDSTIPPNGGVPPVTLSGDVNNAFPPWFRQWLQEAIQWLVKQFPGKPKPTLAVVPTIFAGHRRDFLNKLIIAVEIQFADGYERHIVKLGKADIVGRDEKGWKECAKDRMVASRIFAPVQKFDIEPAINAKYFTGDAAMRCAVVYRDAYTLFGPGAEDRPATLEEAVTWTVRDAQPDPLSAERAVANIFIDLGTWFYPEAKIDKKAAWSFYDEGLQKGSAERSGPDVLQRWEEDKERAHLRRDAVWVLAGRDAPDADPVEKPARFLDPVEFVCWAMAKTDGSRIPHTLVGRSHGDLHGRNILVGVRRGEVEYPAVFDYGDMKANNVLAWDFAKLETELKVRILPKLVREEPIRNWLLKSSKLRSESKSQAHGVPSLAAERADRLAACLAFEELLHDCTERIQSKDEAELLRPVSPPPTGIEKLDRLLSILLRIRREAACWLGFRKDRERDVWRNELYFALAVYGLINVRWKYEPPSQESALVSAGVAAARMPSTPALLGKMMEQGERDPPHCPGVAQTSDCPSYRVPLAVAYRLWKRGAMEDSRKLLNAVAIEVQTNSQHGRDAIAARPAMAHAVPLLGQAALLETHFRQLRLVEPFIETLRKPAYEFHDFEIMGRIGRLYKEIGDSKFSAAGDGEVDDFVSGGPRPAWAQMYDKAFIVYRDAYKLTDDWYTGINAATLAVLTGRTEEAAEYAEKVAGICAVKHDHEQGERFWLLATEGEAALILGSQQALKYYCDALSELSPANYGMADSSYKQVCRLWRVFRDARKDLADRVLKQFEGGEACGALTEHFMNRDFCRGQK